MRRQAIVNAALLALGLGTLGLVWATREAPTSSEAQARAGKLLPRFRSERVSALTLSRAQQRLELVATTPDAGGEHEFHITQPWRERADVATVRSLLGSLDLASPLRPATDVSRAQAGLAEPRLVLEIQSSGEKSRLSLGGPAPSPSGAHYVEVTSSTGAAALYTVSAGLVAELELPFEKFREPRLLEYSGSDIAALELGSGASLVRILQDENGERLLETHGTKELADRQAVDALLEAASRLSTEEFLEPAQARALLPADSLRLSVEPREKAAAKARFTLGGDCPSSPERAIVLREGEGKGDARAGCIPRGLVSAMRAVTPQALRLSSPFFARPDEVEELSIRRGATKLELARKDSGFVLRAPAAGEVALDAGNLRVTDIVRARSQRPEGASPEQLGLVPPGGEVTIQAAGVKERARALERVTLGNPRPDGTLCLRRERDRVVLCLDSEAARAFRTDATLLRGLTVLTFAASELASFSVTGEGRSERVTRSADGNYALAAPSGFSHDGALVADAVQTLGALRAERWLSDTDDGSFGLGAPRLRVLLELLAADGSTKRRELTIGGPGRGGSYAQLDGEAGVFLLPRSELAALETSLIDRSLCPVEPASLAQLELALGQRNLRLTRRGDTWLADPELSPARALELVEAVSSLRAERALHTGAERPNEGLAKPSLRITFTDKAGKRRSLRFGSGDSLRDTSIFYARLDGVDATFAVAQGVVNGLKDF